MYHHSDGGGVIVLAEILGTDMVPLRQRGLYMAMINAMWAFGSVGGRLIGKSIFLLDKDLITSREKTLTA